MHSIIDANRVRQLFLIALILFIGVVLFRELATFLPALLGALTLYILLRSSYFRLTEVKKWKQAPTALLLMLISLLVILFPIALLLQMLSGKVAYALAHSGELVTDRKSTRLNSSHSQQSRMPSSA